MTCRDLPLALVGCDFRVASSRWRSRLVLESEERKDIAQRLMAEGWADGFVDLSTCNRNEWIVSTTNPGWAAQILRGLMLDRLGPGAGVRPYVLEGRDAARHLFRVVLGLESLVVGEKQIATQVFKALEDARALGTASRLLNGLGSIAGRMARIAALQGRGGVTSRGVHTLAVAYLRDHIPLQRARVAVVGLGAIGKRVRAVLEQDPGIEVLGLNRSPMPGALPMDRLPSVLELVDAAVVCTAAPEPVITGAMLQGLGRNLLLVDIGIPEQVERVQTERVVIAGLDELTEYHGTIRGEAGRDDGEDLVEGAMAELVRFCNEPRFLTILDRVERERREMVARVIPGLMEGRFGYLPKEQRQRLEQDLRSALREYNRHIFDAIRDAARETDQRPEDTRRGGR